MEERMKGRMEEGVKGLLQVPFAAMRLDTSEVKGISLFTERQSYLMNTLYAPLANLGSVR